MKKKILQLFLLFSIFSKAQETIPYVENDFLYKGGFVNFYKEAHQIIIDKKLLPCEDKKSLVFQRFLVTHDGEFNKIVNSDAINVNHNCATDLLDQILPELKNWTPAHKDGANITARSSFAFFPDDLFNRYQDGYDTKKLSKDASFLNGGLNSFRDEVAKKVDLSGFNGRGKITVVLRFVVDVDGSVTNVVVEKSSRLKEFDDLFIYAIKRVKKKWEPANFNGVPLKQRYRIPFSINFD